MLRLDHEIAEARSRRQHDLRRIGRLLLALRDESLVGADTRFRLRLAGPRALPHPFQLALQGRLSRRFLLALELHPLLLLLEPAGIIAFVRNALAAIQLK